MGRTLVAAAYADAGRAEAALERVRALDGVEDAAVVVRRADGGVELRQGRQPAVGETLVAGGTIGLVVGLLLGGPVAGAVAGLAGGGGLGARDTGIPDERMRRFGRRLQAGGAALLALAADAAAVERLRAALPPWDGDLLVAPAGDDLDAPAWPRSDQGGTR